MVLALAGVALVVAVTLVMSDVSSLFMRRTALMMVADDAALAGANAIDVGAIYANGVGATLPLDPVLAGELAQASVDAVVDARLRDVRLESVRIAGEGVEVVVSAAVPAPMSGVTGNRTMRIRVRASAATPTRF